jgi:hypothetical protein
MKTTAKRFVKPLCLVLEGERRLVRSIVARAAARGVSVNVDNGDECDLLASDTTDFETVWKSLKSTGHDYLSFRRNGDQIGWVHLVWSDCQEQTIADYSANEITDEILEPLM